MAAINEVDNLNYGITDDVKDALRVLLWRWIIMNGEKKVTLSFWIIRRTFRIRDLHKVFELLLGPKPAFI